MPILKEAEFKKYLSGEKLANLFLIYGDEKMVVKNSTKFLIDKISDSDINEFNFHEFDDESDISSISMAVDVMPFTSPINIVKIKDVNFDSLLSDDFKDLLSIVENCPDTTTIVFTMPTLQIEEKKNFKKIKSYIEKNGVVLNAEHREDLKLEKVLCKWAKQVDCKMTDLTASKLIKYSGNDLTVLHNEIEKLSAYADSSEITEEMIEKLVSKNLEAKVFDLFNLIVSQKSDEVMRSLDILFYQKEEPIMISIILGNAYVDSYRVRTCLDSGMTIKEIAEVFEYKNRAWALEKIARQIKSISTNSIRDSIDEILKTQQKLVSVTVNSEIELQKLVSKLLIFSGVKKHG